MITVRKKNGRALKRAFNHLPIIHYLMHSRRRREPRLSAYVLGGLGLALVAGGIAALMLLSPRTRSRALAMARGTYGKVNAKLERFREHEHEEAAPMSNGLVDREGYPPTTGV